jgi:glycyl-tRNA synthetase
LDGLEITQFTYFQQAGGLDLDPVAVELTYGLERIAMFLQGVKEVWDLAWDEGHTYGDILKMAEIEHCQYDFNVADVERLRLFYDLYEAEAKAAIARGLVIPAYDYVLKCSHTFNLLDTRGAVGVTERANYFRRMRDMSRTVAETYVEQRRRLEFPFLKGAAAASAHVLPAPMPLPAGQQAADLLLEIGVEEMPPHDVRDAIEQLQTLATAALTAARLTHEGVSVTGTPRRLAVYVRNLAAQQAPETLAFRGPPAERGFDSLGQPTAAAIGFARSRGLAVEQLETREEGGKRYLYVMQRVEGKATYLLLPDLLRNWVAGLRFGKSMRWNRSNVSFSRPLRWLVALYGDQIVPFSFADVLSGRTSRGLRPQASPAFTIPSASAYFEAVAAAGVVLDRDARRAQIAAGLQATAAQVDGRALVDEALLDEVTDLVEQPLPLLGRFDPAYLAVPAPALITVMKKHQRYFPVVDADGKLLPYFITVANGADRDRDRVRRGNEAVIRARYADAAYFVRQDRKRPLEDFNHGLAKLTFQEQLGSMLAKVYRLEKLVGPVAIQLGLDEAVQSAAARAALLSKADLATAMVVEMTSLQGVLGEIYALDSGEAPEVARAIREAYIVRPEAPLSPAGLALNLATRLDSLVGLFAVGLAPKGANDPFGLRRDALGIVQNLIAANRSFDIRAGLAAAASLQPVSVSNAVLDEAAEFITRRLYGVLRDEGFGHEVTEAVLAGQGNDPARARQAATDLTAALAQPGWVETLTAFARCKRIVRGLNVAYPLAAAADPEPATRALYAALFQAQAALQTGGDVPALVRVLTDLRGPIDAFFAAVLVMAEDPALRAARLAVVQAIAALPDGIVDLSVLPGF